MRRNLPIIAIDGPSGAGKSTLGRMIARALGLLYIDTGAMYRAIALAVLRSRAKFTDTAAIAELARRARIELSGDPSSLRVMLDGEDVSDEIHSEQVSHVASLISAIPEVRREMVKQQRELGARGGVLVGRDIGTVVFPDADVKFFLTATPEERAQRRYEEDRARAQDLTFDDVLREINIRDERDSTRADSPLRIADDAVVIDTTELSIDEVFERMMKVIREKRAAGESQSAP
ncbi:(d)CMP kinase [Pyrinomonas methylaliphatogenes]|jgi:cytidylate kinase|uniref:Cytidylate kinase n=1 Tax=Pyrinomonas methylaliphatogenes TaxID=454194 RepID=A0A0B6WZN8_9BACT|nr:(d)CMP kinase [Pyrinomonas methylaliphatogenes]MBX5477851.1 (d)CMP kinase [Pyrinomonas methylaliphatogenes]CDM65774.1 cytidylate kinase [Pyrinomonas methylaliphatogenes]